MEKDNSLAILFTIISGIDKLCLSVGDAQAQELISSYIQLLTKIIQNHQGVVIRGKDSEFASLFPTADTAAKASICMQNDVANSSKTGDSALNIRIAFILGDTLNDTINLSEQLAGQADNNQIITTAETLDQMSSNLSSACKELTKIKGLREANTIRVFEMTWENDEEPALMGEMDDELMGALDDELMGALDDDLLADMDDAFMDDMDDDLIAEGDAEEEPRDKIDCSVFSPAKCSPGDFILVQVWIYTPDQTEQIKTLAQTCDDEALERGSKSLSRDVGQNEIVTFHLVCRGLEIDDPIQETVWQGSPTAVQFGVSAPDGVSAKNFIATVTVSQNMIPMGQIKFKITVNSEQEKNPPPSSFGGDWTEFNHFFISYASPDRAEVLKRVQMLRTFNKSYFQDVLDLDPGDRWERQLFTHIQECDAVLLFWSSHAKNSEWVLKECLYAIKNKGIENLIPVIIEGPPPPKPPPELSGLHMNDKILYFI
jgi:hypothetical protein